MVYERYDPERNNRINKIIEGKTARVLSALVAEQVRLGIDQKGKVPAGKIAKQFSKQDGMINRIRFRFRKELVYVHKGVGRGTKASQVGTTKRTAKEWFNPVIERYATEIAAEVADEWVDIIFDKLKLK